MADAALHPQLWSGHSDLQKGTTNGRGRGFTETEGFHTLVPRPGLKEGDLRKWAHADITSYATGLQGSLFTEAIA